MLGSCCNPFLGTMGLVLAFRLGSQHLSAPPAGRQNGRASRFPFLHERILTSIAILVNKRILDNNSKQAHNNYMIYHVPDNDDRQGEG